MRFSVFVAIFGFLVALTMVPDAILAVTSIPTRAPTRSPTAPTRPPTRVPTRPPTRVPTRPPTRVPTRPLTTPPTIIPTAVVTTAPTRATTVPTRSPVVVPTASPTRVPTKQPTAPTRIPTTKPSTTPPTRIPSMIPTAVPSFAPNRQGGQYKCPPYTGSNTRIAGNVKVPCTIVACRGHTIEVSTLGSAIVKAPTCIGDTYLSILNSNGGEIAYNDNANSTSLCSSLRFQAGEQCAKYTILQGCGSINDLCGGTTTITYYY